MRTKLFHNMMRAMAFSVMLSGCIGLALCQGVTDEARLKAEDTFRDIYGKDFDKANLGSAKAKLDFAQKLQKAAEKVATDTVLKLVIQERAIAVASSTQAGYHLAAELYPITVAGASDKSARQNGYILLLEKMLPQEPVATKAKLVTDLIAAYRDLAVIQVKKEAGTPTLFEKARKLTKTYSLANRPETKEIVKELDKLEKDFEKSQSATKELNRLKSAVAKNAEDSTATLALAQYYQKEGSVEEVRKVFAASSVPQLKAIAEAESNRSTEAELARLYLVAADELKGDTKLLLTIGSKYQRAVCDRCPPVEKIAELKKLGALHEKLISLETGSTRLAWAEEEARCLAEQIAAHQTAGNGAELPPLLAKIRQIALTHYKASDQKELLGIIDAKTRDIEKWTSMTAEAASLEAKIKSRPTDFASHTSLGLLLLQLQKPQQAAPHLVKSDRKELRQLGELLLNANPDHLAVAKAYRAISDEKSGFPNADVRLHYELALQASPALPDADRIRLIISQMPVNPPSLVDQIHKALSPNGLLVLFDGQKEFVELLQTQGFGGGQVTLDKSDRWAGRASLRVTPARRGIAKFPGGPYQIAEKPKSGQFRYIQFAWKKIDGNSIMLEICHSGAASALLDEPSWFRYVSGLPTGIRAIHLSNSLPSTWQVETRDLFKDFGEFQLYGISFSSLDGTAGLFDSVQLSATADDFRKKRLP